MVAGHLQEKKGYYYAVLSYYNSAGKRKTKWISTGLPVKGWIWPVEATVGNWRMKGV